MRSVQGCGAKWFASRMGGHASLTPLPPMSRHLNALLMDYKKENAKQYGEPLITADVDEEDGAASGLRQHQDGAEQAPGRQDAYQHATPGAHDCTQAPAAGASTATTGRQTGQLPKWLTAWQTGDRQLGAAMAKLLRGGRTPGGGFANPDMAKAPK